MGEKVISRRRLIRLGAVLGLGSVGASMAAGCGVEIGSSETQGSPTAAADAPEVGEGEAIAKGSELAPGTALPFTNADTGQAGILVRLQSGEFAAYSAVCTHQACTVAYKDGKLACPCHGSVFDPAKSAAVVTGPAQTPLPEMDIEIKEGKVFLA
ncbi:MAG: Rieske 2Fe-2S domain-containing protein [Actinobacteria bacterium]|nr:Rieske 2Fe-2S domain-containing protein [Actinomycetota bacterium]